MPVDKRPSSRPNVASSRAIERAKEALAAQRGGLSRPEADDDDWDRDVHEPVHVSRDQEYPSDEPIHDDIDDDGDWSPPSLLEAPPPRPGYVQRWVRVEKDGRVDARNWSARSREGWQPRNPATVPGGYAAPTANHGNLGSCIMVEGLVLCEMSARRAKQRKDYYSGRLRNQTAAIDKDLLRVQQPGHPIDRTATSRVTVGTRRPPVQQDDDAA